MKTILLASALITTALSGSAFAGELCGTLDAHTVGPHCAAGAICPMFIRLQYDLTTADGTRYDLETSSTPVLENFGQFKGTQVCVDGSQVEDSFSVTTISAQ